MSVSVFSSKGLPRQMPALLIKIVGAPRVVRRVRAIWEIEGVDVMSQCWYVTVGAGGC